MWLSFLHDMTWLDSADNADEKKDSFLVSVVNKSQYRDTHSEDTIGNVRDTHYLSFVWSC